MRSKEESEKASLKPSIQNTKITAPSSITSWQIEGEKVQTVTDFIFLGSKITVDSDCSHEIKRCLLLGRKAVINLDCVLENRDTTFLTKVYLVKAMVFPVVMCVGFGPLRSLNVKESMLSNCGAGKLLKVP